MKVTKTALLFSCRGSPGCCEEHHSICCQCSSCCPSFYRKCQCWGGFGKDIFEEGDEWNGGLDFVFLWSLLPSWFQSRVNEPFFSCEVMQMLRGLCIAFQKSIADMHLNSIHSESPGLNCFHIYMLQVFQDAPAAPAGQKAPAAKSSGSSFSAPSLPSFSPGLIALPGKS